MAQDKDGFMWFSTETGLSRFDGTHFKNFTTADGLPTNDILKIFPDSKGRVWLIPFKNTLAYYWKGKIYTGKEDPVLRKIKLNSNVLSFGEDKEGNILIRELRNLSIIHPDGSTACLLYFRGEPFWTLIEQGLSSKGGFRVGLSVNPGTLNIADIYHDTLTLINKMIAPHGSNINCSYLGPKFEIFKHKDNLLFMDSVGNQEFAWPIPADMGLIGISHLNDSSIAINSYTNTYLLDLREKKIKDSFLKDLAVNSVMEDSEGSLWFSTLGKGVYRLGSTEIRNYALREKNSNLAVFCVGELDGAIYTGGERFFLGILDHQWNKIRGAQIIGEVIRGRITALTGTKRSGIILGTDQGLYHFNGFGKKPAALLEPDRSVKTLILEDGNTLLEASNYDVRRISLIDKKVIDTIWPRRATCVHRQNGFYFVGTFNGLYTVDQNKKTVWLGDSDHCFTVRIIAMDSSADGTLWIATDGEGLIGYKDGRIIARITEQQGLTSNLCRSLFITSEAVWVGTAKGLNKVAIPGPAYKIIHFTMADGLNADIINAIYVRGKEVYVGTSEGLSYFDESKISKRSGCNLHITGIAVSGRKWAYDSTGFTLPHEDNNIQIDFAGISFKSAGDIVYRYRLIGLDDRWKTTNETFLSYPSLPSGSYELQMTATNKFGVQSSALSVKFAVDKLLWEKLWFRAAVLLLTVALVILLFNYRVKKVREKDAEKMNSVVKMAELEQMALRSQMNPHFIFNCMNSIQEFIIDKDVLGANEFITKFSHLIRKTLDVSSQSLITIQEEVDYISTYLELESKRFGNKFVCEVILDGSVDPHSHLIPPMILQPYLENAVRHGMGHRQDKNGRISVRISLHAPYMRCIIEDNGVGRRLAARYKSKNAIRYQSKGMNLVAQRVEMLNRTGKIPILIEIEDLEEEDGTALGTRITLNFPMNELS